MHVYAGHGSGPSRGHRGSVGVRLSRWARRTWRVARSGEGFVHRLVLAAAPPLIARGVPASAAAGGCSGWRGRVA